jgi:hypothetical protein
MASQGGGRGAQAALLTGFDIVIRVVPEIEDYRVVGRRLAELAKKFVFQRERSEAGGIEHYQCRILTRKRIRLAAFVREHGGEHVWNGHIQATSNSVHASNRQFNYVMKLDTRVAGPWNEEEFDLANQPVLTRQLRHFQLQPPRPWQVKVKGYLQSEDDRSIHLIIDHVGHVGKSIFAEDMEYKGLATEIPVMESVESTMQVAHASVCKKAFMVDMPRALNKQNLHAFYAGIECIKNGQAWDRRYKYKKVRFDRPAVVIFTNVWPKFKYMSKDRWVIHLMKEDYDLMDLTLEQAQVMAKNSKAEDVDGGDGPADEAAAPAGASGAVAPEPAAEEIVAVAAEHEEHSEEDGFPWHQALGLDDAE